MQVQDGKKRPFGDEKVSRAEENPSPFLGSAPHDEVPMTPLTANHCPSPPGAPCKKPRVLVPESPESREDSLDWTGQTKFGKVYEHVFGLGGRAHEDSVLVLFPSLEFADRETLRKALYKETRDTAQALAPKLSLRVDTVLTKLNTKVNAFHQKRLRAQKRPRVDGTRNDPLMWTVGDLMVALLVSLPYAAYELSTNRTPATVDPSVPLATLPESCVPSARSFWLEKEEPAILACPEFTSSDEEAPQRNKTWENIFSGLSVGKFNEIAVEFARANTEATALATYNAFDYLVRECSRLFWYDQKFEMTLAQLLPDLVVPMDALRATILECLAATVANDCNLTHLSTQPTEHGGPSPMLQRLFGSCDYKAMLCSAPKFRECLEKSHNMYQVFPNHVAIARLGDEFLALLRRGEVPVLPGSEYAQAVQEAIEERLHDHASFLVETLHSQDSAPGPFANIDKVLKREPIPLTWNGEVSVRPFRLWAADMQPETLVRLVTYCLLHEAILDLFGAKWFATHIYTDRMQPLLGPKCGVLWNTVLARIQINLDE